MSFTQRYKQNIIDLLNKNTNKNKNANVIPKITNNNNNYNHFHIVNIKNSKNQVAVVSEREITSYNHCNNSNMNSYNSFSIFNNKKIKAKVNKKTNTNKIYNKKLMPIFKIHYRNIRKINNCFSDDKIKVNSNYNYKSMKLIRNIDDEINKDLNKNVKFLLLKNDSKHKMINKIERLNFYKKINKVYNDINFINKKNIYFNKSLFLLTPLDSIYQKMEL